MKLLAFDPSLSCTGWALLNQDGPSISLANFGFFEPPEGDDLAPKLKFIHTTTRERIKAAAPDVISVELPQTVSMGQSRNARTLPSYGAAVGIVLAAAIESGAKVVTITATEWGRLAKRTRGRAGAAKENRVQMVRVYFGVELGVTIRNKAKAGNVADAALLGRYAINKIDTERLVAA
ncbi:MAG: crossover junction endodeoxyribonuclease RuvC [Planctomycetes bacterium]|nr:crossover junction endodeoxyribonuclease RuvC [Planctomycetota bacterium]